MGHLLYLLSTHLKTPPPKPADRGRDLASWIGAPDAQELCKGAAALAKEGAAKTAARGGRYCLAAGVGNAGVSVLQADPGLHGVVEPLLASLTDAAQGAAHGVDADAR